MSHPKIVISPIYVQFVTFTIVFLLFFLKIYTASVAGSLLLLDSSVSLLVFLSLTMSFGLAQTPLVRYLCGVKGTEGDLSIRSYLVNSDIGSVASVLQRFDVAKALDLKDSRRTEYGIIYELNSSSADTFRRILLTEDAEEAGKSQIAVIAYRLTYFSIERVSDEDFSKTTRPLELALQQAAFEVEEGKGIQAAEALTSQLLRMTSPSLVPWKLLSAYQKITLSSLSVVLVTLLLVRNIFIIPDVYFYLLTALVSISLLFFFFQFGIKKSQT
ncbi:MAG: hypothetical protein QXX17_07490 [Conexivisphaerales archaeon]